ncbi:ATP-binding protein [Curvivirga sp.]|uniref:ATP-binding protein n=1 Tax=Curvivirga sp. TaxID=2856848 RepID=UPI003B5BEB56
MYTYEKVLKSRAAILQQIVEGAKKEEILLQLCRDTEANFPGVRCTILSYASSTQQLFDQASPSMPRFYTDAIDGVEVGPNVGSCGVAAYYKKRVIVPDVYQSENWAPFIDIVKKTDFHACWSQPILAKDAELFGTFAMYYDQARHPTNFELELMEGQANLASLVYERAQTAEALRYTSMHLDQLAEAQNDAICRLDRNLNFIYVNNSYTENIGFGRDDVLNKPVLEFIAPADRGTFVEDMKNLSPENNSNVRYDHNFDKDGQLVLYQWKNRASFTEDGDLLEIQCIGRNVMKSLEVERELHQQMLRYDQAVKLSGVGYWVWDTISNRLDFISKEAAKIFDISQDSALGLTDEIRGKLTFIHPDDRERYRENFIKALKSQQGYSLDVRILTMKGEERHIHELAEPIFDEKTGGLTQMLVTIQDVTRQKITEKQLINARIEAETANKAKSDFLANMSHELRTPLNAIIGFSELLNMSGKMGISEHKVEEYAGDIHAAGTHLLSIINDILDVAKIEADQLQFYDEEVDVKQIFKSVTRLLSKQANDAGLVIRSNVENDLPFLRADTTRVKQIVTNLTSNAVKFTDHAGEVMLSASMQDGDLEIKIEDTGIGIAEIDIPKILGKFGQVDSTYNRNYDGTGLGLSLVQLLVEAHQAKFDIQSELGVGTTVIVTFPKERVIHHN